MKYVLLGAMSSAILLYGFALLYGLTGTTDLAGIARASGVPSVMEANTTESLAKSVHEALASNTLTTIISKVEAIGPKTFHMDLPLLENRFQFKRSLEAMQKHTSALDL